MHFSIRYLTDYRYREPVTDSLNALRVKPATTAHQRVDDFGVRVEPETRLHQHLDYYGTTVIEFGISKPHEQLAIEVRARVATPAATLQAVAELIPERFEYRTGVTYVGSTVEDLLDAGAGVCQDFAHLALLLLRRHGLAARYVSGYLWAPPDGDESTDSAEMETHAWIEALVPGDREPIWVPADPTNRTLGGESHVKIGHGRNYGDVPPVKGVFRGGAGAELSASVKMQRTDPTPART